jgi:hypothetical protein
MLRTRLITTTSAAASSATRRGMTTTTTTDTSNPPTKIGGDIGDSFASVSGAQRAALPDRFRQLKLDLIRGNEQKLLSSWRSLTTQLKTENQAIKTAKYKPALIPEVRYTHLLDDCARLRPEIQKRGAVVVRGVVPEDEARGYKGEVEKYVGMNPQTKGFPRDNPQVFELYHSPPQLKARTHPDFLAVQRALLSSLWTASPAAPISLRNPLVYLDRLRIRQPGDTSFAVGPHMDGGSTERWEPEGYGAGGSGVYDDIFKGEWESYNPWDAGSGRVEAVTNLYDGRGACSMLRLWQGWLSMSHSGPGEGTVLVYPLVKLATAYLLLRPFFRAIRGREEFIVSDKEGGEEGKERFLDPEKGRMASYCVVRCRGCRN